MTSAPGAQPTSDRDYTEAARRHLWRHFADMSAEAEGFNVIVRGEGSYLFDQRGRKYLDAVSNLFCVNVGYSYGEELGEAALAQYRKLGYHSSWLTTHPAAIELAEELARLAPADLNHVFLTPSGGEAVEAAWKIARQFYLLHGENRWKAIARDMAYHGTTLGALSLMGIRASRTPFEPLLAQSAHVRCTRRIGRPADETEDQFTALLLDDLEQRILSEDPATVAMIIMEPVQNHGGSLPPPRGYSVGVRALADKYGILLVADETITAFGRVGDWFGSERFEMRPDIITTAKGLSSAHAVIGATIVSDEVYEPFTRPGVSLRHGNTFGGHPVMAAVALKNLEILKRLDLPNKVLEREPALEAALRSLEELDVVVDVRGAGYFWSVELNGEHPSGRPLEEGEVERIYGQRALAGRLEERGVMVRASTDNGCPVICIAPPLVAEEQEFVLIRDALREVLTMIDRERLGL